MTEKEKLEEAKRLYQTANADQKYVLESLFPELAESADERIRKALIDLIKSKEKDGYMVINNFSTGSILAWLEKQVEQKPKFHEGDWIIFNENHNSVYQIEKIQGLRYYLRHYNGGSMSVHIDNQLIRLWTIQDAKAGDVLAAHECLVLFKKLDGLNIRCYCTYHFMNNTSFHVDTLQNKTAFHPATKEQRDALEKAMADAGYIFNYEKKELKKVEDENYDGEDYGIDSLFHAQRILEKTLGKVDGYQTDDGILSHNCAISAVKKLYEQKPTWSEDDEHRLKDTIYFIDAAKIHYASMVELDACIDWLKSIKQRMGGEEWMTSNSNNV